MRLSPRRCRRGGPEHGAARIPISRCARMRLSGVSRIPERPGSAAGNSEPVQPLGLASGHSQLRAGVFVFRAGLFEL